MFAVGVDEMSWDDLDERHYDWPTRQQVKEYRDQVRELVDELIRSLPLTLPITWESPFWGIMMGIEHERIHLETSSVLIRQLPIDQVVQLPFWDICRRRANRRSMNCCRSAGGKVVLGKSQDHALYGWDNEYGLHEAEVTGFKAGKYLVSNREFLEFVEAGGYRDRQWWNEEGWHWREFKQAEHPLFWLEDGGRWKLRTMPRRYRSALELAGGGQPAGGKGVLQLEVAARPASRSGCRPRMSGTGCGTSVRSRTSPTGMWRPAIINLEYWASSCPIDRFRSGEFFDVIGNVWQWTETPIYPFHGFEIHPWYDDFSTPTFDTRHNLIKGGSWISTGNEATRAARYAFRRHFFQHAGFRYVESSAPVIIHEDQLRDRCPGGPVL